MTDEELKSIEDILENKKIRPEQKAALTRLQLENVALKDVVMGVFRTLRLNKELLNALLKGRGDAAIIAIRKDKE